MLTNAIVRPPGTDFAEGLTTVDMGAPVLEKAVEQHERYCEALQRCGLILTRLEAALSYPDSTFVEDTAILTDRCAILTRPGANSREGEVPSIKEVLVRFYPSFHVITPPGTLDGGDVCQAGDHFFIGISGRTNEEGARQLAGFLEQERYTATCIDIRRIESILHLKSGLAYLGGNRLVVIDVLGEQEAFRRYDVVRVEAVENYAANCVRVNDHVLLAAGYPVLLNTLRSFGYPVVTLEMSEFQKMNGGLSCLSLRF